jgi:ATP-dependent Clp protease ATP-binding subunit ClpA
MAGESFHLITVTRCLEEGGRVVEALGCPEISALADTEREALAKLRLKAKAVLEDPKLSPAALLYRRCLGAEAALDKVELKLDPPKRSADWEEPVMLRLPFVRWVEDELHQAWVPALGALVFATREALLREKVVEHAKLLLAGRPGRLTLRELARLARVESLTLGELEVTAELKSPRQLAEADNEEEEEPSMLVRLAEELPPLLADKPGKPSPPCAFEMEAELKQLAEALAGDLRRSVLLLGPPGCGKTALVRELARRRSEFGFPKTPFWSTNGARLMSGQVGFGMWQERCQQLCREAARTQSLVHLQNLADLLEVGKASRGAQSVGGFLRPWIARGELTVIAECTPEQLGVIERVEPHLPSAFRHLVIAEPTGARTRAILGQVLAQTTPSPRAAPTTAAELALSRLHQLHQRYATYSANPGRPVRFLKHLLADAAPEPGLTEAAVIEAFSRETGLPRVLLDDALPLDLEATREWFAQRVIGQPEAVARVLDLLAMTKARLARPGKPLASLLLIGPTGTGKTEMAKALAAFLFGDAARMTRFDLNQFNDPFAVQRLMGGAGTGEGLLTAKVREQPFSVLLLDEFEKADPSFFDLLLQILGDGRLTDAAGRVADFSNCVIVMTSNLGAQGFQRGPAGFQADGGAADASEHFTTAVRQFLRPEIFNRLDAVVPFQPLGPETILAIARRQLELAWQRDGVRLRAVEVTLDPAVAEQLAARGYDARYGARPLRRALESELLTPLAEALNEYAATTPLRAEISVSAGQYRVNVGARTEALSESARQAAQGEMELVAEVMSWRRRVGQLAASSAVKSLENEATMLNALERRLARAQRKPSAPPPRLALLPRLREALAGVRGLAERAIELEDRVLAAFHARLPVARAELTAPLTDLAGRCRQLQREVFRLLHPRSDEVVLACYSEHPGTLVVLALAYRRLAEKVGAVLATEILLPPKSGRTVKTRLARESVTKPVEFWAKPPENLIGVVLHVRGDLAHPWLAAEVGLHEFVQPNANHLCLVQATRPPLKDYEPPAGIERPGGLKARGAKLRRRYKRTARQVEDTQLGEVPWSSSDPGSIIAALSEQALEREIQAATR